MKGFDWLHENPHLLSWKCTPEHIDHYGHVNNVAYIAQIERVAWSHSHALGLNIETFRSLDRAMVVQSHNVRYKLPCFLKDTVSCATWITQINKKLTLKRKFQYICESRNKTVFEADTTFVCVALSSGRPVRMPICLYDIYNSACIGVET